MKCIKGGHFDAQDAEATAEAIQERLDDPDTKLDEEEKLYYKMSPDVQQEYPWKLTKINNIFKMTRPEGQFIAIRNLKWFEKIKFLLKIGFIKTKGNNKK